MGALRSPLFVGIDVSKNTLDVAAGTLRFQVSNDRKGHVELLGKVRGLRRRCHFIYESAGANGRLMDAFLHGKRCRLSSVSAYRVRQYAKAMGVAKTDALDAIVLSEYGASVRPEPTPKPDRINLKLGHMVRRRLQLIKTLHAHDRRADDLWDAQLKRSAARLRQFLEQQLKEIEADTEEFIRRNPQLTTKRNILCTVKGIGRISATQIMAELPELGTLNRRRLAAIAGLAPINYDTGGKDGKRSIHGGRFYLRQALFMPALVAIKLNGILNPFYKRLRESGKPHRVALVAVMRKLLIHLNSLARTIAPA